MTNRPTIPGEIEVLPTRGAPGFLTTGHMLVLQRRSETSSLEAGVPLGSVSVEPRSGEWLVRVSNAAGYQEARVIGLDRAIVAAAELATRLVGTPVRPARRRPLGEHGRLGCRCRLVAPGPSGRPYGHQVTIVRRTLANAEAVFPSPIPFNAGAARPTA